MSKYDTFYGFDPGGSGAVCRMRRNLGYRPETVRLKKVDAATLLAWLKCSDWFEIAVCGLELVGGRRGDYVNKLAAFMRSTGWLDAIIELAGLNEVEEIPPKEWEAEFGLLGIPTYEERKKQAHITAHKLYPDLPILKDEADAILICTYMYRKYTGELTYGKDQTKERRQGTGIRWQPGQQIKDLPAL